MAMAKRPTLKKPKPGQHEARLGMLLTEAGRIAAGLKRVGALSGPRRAAALRRLRRIERRLIVDQAPQTAKAQATHVRIQRTVAQAKRLAGKKATQQRQAAEAA